MTGITNNTVEKQFNDFEKSKSLLFKENIVYKPFKYPWAEEMRKKHEIIHWVPNEIPMGNDVTQWNNGILSYNEKSFVTNILRLFTEMDAVVGRNYKQNFIPKILNNEVSSLLASFCNREALHTEAYALINDTIGLPETEYASFLQIKELSDKVDYAMDADTSTVRGFALAVAKSVFNEGVSLFSSFVMLLNFQRYGKMMGMNKVVEWSIRDESLTLDTEVLTERGWITIDNVNIGDKILEWDMQTQEVSFQEIHTIKDVTRTTSYVYESDIFHQHVSGGHRMIIEKGTDITESTGEELQVEDDFNFIMAGNKNNGFVLTDEIKNKIIETKQKSISFDWIYEIINNIDTDTATEILDIYERS